jgi:murein DD-endopeptidase MepM/ murein hydrolase activator NlpD
VLAGLALAAVVLGSAPLPAHAQEPAPGVYTVAPGDTLGAIASRFGVPLDVLIATNGIDDPNRIRAGQSLVIPDASGALPVAAIATTLVSAGLGDTVASLARQYGQDPALVGQLNDSTINRRLFPGQPLRLPVAAATPAPLRFGAVTAVRVPQSIVQGRTGRIFLTSARPLELTAALGAQPLTWLPLSEDGRQHFAFVPVAALQEPGQYPLTIGYTTGRGEQVARTWPLEVGVGDYDYQEIQVSDEKAQELTPEVVQAERTRVVELWSQMTPVLVWREPFARPIAAEFATTSPFGTRRTYSVADIGNFHAGQDFGAPEGVAVTAPAPGVVVLTEELAVRGNAVILDHGGGVFTGYWHLSEVKVAPGQQVNTGDVIGAVGNTGLSTGAHLHWELRIDGVAVDPMQFIDEAPLEGSE